MTIVPFDTKITALFLKINNRCHGILFLFGHIGTCRVCGRSLLVKKKNVISVHSLHRMTLQCT